MGDTVRDISGETWLIFVKAKHRCVASNARFKRKEKAKVYSSVCFQELDGLEQH